MQAMDMAGAAPKSCLLSKYRPKVSQLEVNFSAHV